MKKVLNYISYQNFPADTANSLQTISNLKYLAKNHYEIKLYFPLRENNSSDDLKVLQKYYFFNENIFRIRKNCGKRKEEFKPIWGAKAFRY